MPSHFDFFACSVPEAQELAKIIDWERAFDLYDVLQPNIGLLASAMKPDRSSSYRNLAEKLHILLDLPFLRKPKFKDTCDETLHVVCSNSGFLKTDDAVNLAHKLIQCGADVNVKSKRTGHTCLQEALEGNPKLVQLLLESGAAIGEYDLFSCQHAESVQSLIASGASWKAVEPSDLALKLCRLEMPALTALTEAMTREGFSIQDARWNGESMLHIAAAHRDEAVLAYLMPFFSDLDLPNNIGQTALIKTCIRAYEDAEPVLRLLLSKGASIQISDAVGKTALMWAVQHADKEKIVAELLKHKPDLAARDTLGNTALHYCAARLKNQHLSHLLAQMLLDAGADINATNSFGQTALMLLAQKTPKAVAVLVQGGAALDVTDHAGSDVYRYAGSESKKWLTSHSGKKRKPLMKLSSAPGVKVAVTRSPKILQQIAVAHALRDELVTKLTRWLPAQQISDHPEDNWTKVLLSAQLGSEGVRVKVEQVQADEVDRMGSMLSGPLFISKQYPMVKGGYPLVQLDLRVATAISGKALGDGLLQLWETASYGVPLVRVIPRVSVSVELTTAFDSRRLRDQLDTATSSDWNSDPAQGVVQVFKSYRSSGFQTESLQEALEYSPSAYAEDPPPALLKLTKRFYASLAKAKVYEDEIQLFGSFDSIQYTHTEVGKHLLFTIPYGSSGSAEVFYEIGADGKVAFSSDSSTR